VWQAEGPLLLVADTCQPQGPRGGQGRKGESERGDSVRLLAWGWGRGSRGARAGFQKSLRG